MQLTRTSLQLCVGRELEVTARMLEGEWAEKGMLRAAESFSKCPAPSQEAGALGWHYSGQHAAEEGG